MDRKTVKPTKMISTVLEKYGLNPDTSCWDCHGTLVINHKACKIIAKQAGIEFGAPMIVQSDAEKGIVVILVEGTMPTANSSRTEWSFGEATPKNNKNSYPFAMAEKRAKDRITLSLAGIHGYVYSEMEADDFRETAPEKPKSIHKASIQSVEKEEPQANSLINWIDELNAALMACGCEGKTDANQVCRWLWDGEVTGVDECRDDSDKARDTIYKMDMKTDSGINRNDFLSESTEYAEVE